MTQQFIQIDTDQGQSFDAYLALPESGSGPGLVLIQEIFGINAFMRETADRFAQEGYVVIVPDLFWRMQRNVDLSYGSADFTQALDYHARLDGRLALLDIASSITALRALPQHSGKVGTIGYCLGGRLACHIAAQGLVDCAISYYGVNIDAHLPELASITCPLVLHIAGNDSYCTPSAQAAIAQALQGHQNAEIYTYAGCDHAFATPGRPQFDKPAAMMAYSRSLACLRKTMGPHYDLNALWDAHCRFEFQDRDVAAIMPTMVAEPYVNHVPVMTGGVGQRELSRFYQHHFVNANPADTQLIPISRTIGTDRLVDEFIFRCTHDREIDWLLPGVAATGKPIEIAMLAVVCFRGDKLYNEHIYWDQASVLVQIGLLNPAGLPTAGVETSRKMLDESLPSNALMPAWAGSATPAATAS